MSKMLRLYYKIQLNCLLQTITFSTCLRWLQMSVAGGPQYITFMSKKASVTGFLSVWSFRPRKVHFTYTWQSGFVLLKYILFIMTIYIKLHWGLQMNARYLCSVKTPLSKSSWKYNWKYNFLYISKDLM